MKWDRKTVEYHHRNMEGYIREQMEIFELPWKIQTDEVIVDGKKLTQYNFPADEEGKFLLEGFFFEDIQRLCETCPIDPEGVISLVIEELAKDYEYMKENEEMIFDKSATQYLYPVLINTELQRAYLGKIPYKERGELSVALRLGIPAEQGSGYTFFVSNEILRSWNMEFEEAFEMAVNNPWFLDQCMVLDKADLQKAEQELIKEQWCGLFQISREETEEFYLLKGKNVECEAMLLIPDFVEKMREKMGGDFLVAFLGDGQTQIIKPHEDLEDIEYSVEFANEEHGYWAYLTNKLYSCTEERGLEPLKSGDRDQLNPIQKSSQRSSPVR